MIQHSFFTAYGSEAIDKLVDGESTLFVAYGIPGSGKSRVLFGNSK